MATRHLNYTGRKRILERDIDIVVDVPHGAPPTFNASLNLTKYEFPTDAIVFVEAYRQTRWMRFHFGTIAHLTVPNDRRLTEFDSTDAILFRVKVASSHGSTGLLLGAADRIQPVSADDAPEPKLSLLRVQKARLDDQVWKLQIDSEPVLLINERLGDWRGIVRQPGFIQLVCPAILREILHTIHRTYEEFEYEDANDWKSRWSHFARALPGVSDPPDEDDDEKVEEWIDEVVRSFCRRQKFLETYLQAMSAGGS